MRPGSVKDVDFSINPSLWAVRVRRILDHVDEVSKLSEANRQWLVADEAVWARSHEIVGRHPHLDVSGVYHTLKNLQRSPAERLRRGLAHARLGPYRR